MATKGLFTDRELQAIDYSIRCARGHYLFSRCWLLVEGESDFHLMPLLFEAMGHSQNKINFSVLEISQVIEKGEPLIKFAKHLGIEWFMMADGDHEGKGYIERAKSYLEHGEDISDRARTLSCADIEHEFWHNNYNDFIENLILSQQITNQPANDYDKKAKQTIKEAIKQAGLWHDGYKDFIQNMALPQRTQSDAEIIDKSIKTKQTIKSAIKQAGGKPAFAQALAGEVQKRGAATIPQSIQDIIKRVVQLAGD